MCSSCFWPLGPPKLAILGCKADSSSMRSMFAKRRRGCSFDRQRRELVSALK